VNHSRLKRQLDALQTVFIRHRLDMPRTAMNLAAAALIVATRDLRNNPSNAVNAIETAQHLLDQFAC
jgi:hypothetical protein